MENILTESLLEILQKMHKDCEINTYYVPYLPHRIYIEAPGIVEIQEFMRCSTDGHIVSRAMCILDDINCDFFAQHQRSRCSLPWVMGLNHTGWPLQGRPCPGQSYA